MSQKNTSIGMNELVDYQKKEYGKTMDRIMKFLWKCGGADAQILQYAPYSDHIKAAGIGGVVLATTVMAMIAMGFAMHTIFGENTKYGHQGNWFVTIPAALVWGLIIFNLDRFIVSTVKGDGTEKITWGEWGAMLPRLLMAIIIGLTISAPLETHIFEKEINREWERVTNKLVQNRMDEIEGVHLTNIQRIDTLISIKTKERDKVEDIYQKNKSSIDSLIKNKICNGGRVCPNQAHQVLYKNFDASEKDRNKFQSELDALNKDRQKEVEKLETEKKENKVKLESQKPGFLDQLMMLENLASHGETYNPIDPATKKPRIDPETNQPVMEELYGSAGAPIWLVRLLFMIVEIAPVVFKFMIWDSSYDYMKDNVAQILEAKQGISLESFPDEDNNTHRIRKNYNAERIVEVAKRQNELEKENAIHAITLYAEQERKEIEENPEAFVQNQDKPGESNETEPTPNA